MRNLLASSRCEVRVTCYPVVHIIRRHRDIGAQIAAVSLIELAIVVPRAAWVDLHYEFVFQTHPCHFCQHLSAKEFLLLGIGAAGDYATKEFRSLCCGEIRGSRSGMPVIGRRAAEIAKAQPRPSERVQVARPSRGVFPGHLAEPCNISGESLKLRIDNRIWPESRQNPRLPSGFADGLVIVERIERRIGGRQHFQIETLGTRRIRQLSGSDQDCGRVVSSERTLTGDGHLQLRSKCWSDSGSRHRAMGDAALRMARTLKTPVVRKAMLAPGLKKVEFAA